jgi:hypothetical protein
MVATQILYSDSDIYWIKEQQFKNLLGHLPNVVLQISVGSSLMHYMIERASLRARSRA